MSEYKGDRVEEQARRMREMGAYQAAQQGELRAQQLAMLEQALAPPRAHAGAALRYGPSDRNAGVILPRASEPVRCTHSLMVDAETDGYICANRCGLYLDGRALHAFMRSKGWTRQNEHAGAERAIADAMTLRSENRDLLAENARLRRQLERGRR